MNYRDLVAKIKSPTGRIILFILVAIVVALIALNSFSRTDETALQVVKDEVTDQATLEINSNIPAFSVSKEKPPQKIDEPSSEPDALVDGATASPAPAAEPPVVGEKKTPTLLQRPPSRPTYTVNPTPATGNRYTYRNNVVNASKGKVEILVVDGENSDGQNTESDVFLSERFAPFGRLISCKLVNTLESNVPGTPLIAMVTEDLYWINANGQKQLIIPAGTEVLGTVNGAARNRMLSGNQFTFVWQATSAGMVGYEMSLQGMALEKSHEPMNKTLATITDMSAGIPGQIIANDNLDKIMMLVMAAVQGAAQGFQTNSVYTNDNSTIVSNDGSTKNAISMAAESVAQVAMQQLADKISKETYYIRVAAGTEFYLYVTQVIDLDQARIANSLLSPNQRNNQEVKAAGQDARSQLIQSFINSQPQNKMINRQIRGY